MTTTNWNNITDYMDTVGTSIRTFTFNKTQNLVKVTIRGNANVTYAIGSQSGTLTPGQSITVTEKITSFTLTAVSGIQTVEVWAIEDGTTKVEDNGNSLDDVVTYFADIAPYDVKKYGAKGDGVTDDTAAIQSAINAANTTGGGTVYFPNGTFLVTATLKVYSNINLSGQSRWNSIIQLSPNVVTLPLFDCSGTSTTANKNITFENLHLKHVLGLSGSPTTDGKGVLIYGQYTQFCQVNRCVFSDYTFAAIYLNYTTDTTIWGYSWQIQGNIFLGNIVLKQISNNTYYGIWLDQQAEYVGISGNQFLYMQAGVFMTDSPNHRIVNNQLESCNDAVKHTAVAFRTNGKLIISNNTMNHCYNSGINIQVMCNAGNANGLQSGCVISNNIILLPVVYGLTIQGGLGHVITGNKIISSNSGDKGILLKDYNGTNLFSYCMVTNNVVQSNISGGTGVLDSSGVTGTGNIITNNILAVTP